MPLAVLRRHEEVGDVQADGLLLGPPERPLGGGVPLDDHAGPVGDDDGVVAGGQHGLVPALARPAASRRARSNSCRAGPAGGARRHGDGRDGRRGRFGRGRHPGCLGSRDPPGEAHWSRRGSSSSRTARSTTTVRPATISPRVSATHFSGCSGSPASAIARASSARTCVDVAAVRARRTAARRSPGSSPWACCWTFGFRSVMPAAADTPPAGVACARRVARVDITRGADATRGGDHARQGRTARRRCGARRRKAQETWVGTHDSAVGTYGEGERAHRTAFAALKHAFEKVGDHWEPKRRKGPSDPQAAGSSRTRRPTAEGVDANALEGAPARPGAPARACRGRSRMDKGELVDAVKKANRRETAKARRG